MAWFASGAPVWRVGSTPQNKEPRRLLFEALKVAATYSPTTCSTIGVAELGVVVCCGAVQCGAARAQRSRCHKASGVLG